MKKKVKLAFIVKASKRRSEFRKRKRVFLKKLEEFTTLCGVKAGAVVYGSRYDDKGDGPEVWPSPEGFQEVVSTFMALPEAEGVKNKMDHASYLKERIRIEEEKVRLLRNENREAKLKQFMFDCLEGKKKVSECDVNDLQDFGNYIDGYIHQINNRIEHLTIVGESSSSSSSLPPPFLASGGQGPDHLAVEEPYRPTTMEEPVQHQTPINFNGQTQHGIYDTNINQNINQQGSFMSLLMQQMMGNVEGHAPHMPSMDDNNNNKPPPTTDH